MVFIINIQKCAIIGCGFVGATCAYTLMQSQLFSEIVLIDVNKKKAEGEADDLNHGLPFNSPMKIFAGEYCDTKDAYIVIITAGANQNIGETRTDLLEKNSKIFKNIIENLLKFNNESILLVVTNPVDILTYLTEYFSSLPPKRIIGSGTVLDTARLKYLVGNYLDVDYRNIHSFIIGEHGDSEFPVWSSANVSGIDLDKFCHSCCKTCSTDHLNSIFESVRSSAYRIIEAKGATYYGIAESVKKIVSAIVKNEETILPVSAILNGQYGLTDIALSLPCVVGKNGIHDILEIPLNEAEKKMLLGVAEKQKEIISSLKNEYITIV